MKTNNESLTKNTKEQREVITLPDGRRVFKDLHEKGLAITRGLVKNLNEQVIKEQGELVTLPDGEIVTKYLFRGEVMYILQNGKHVLKRNYKTSPSKLHRIFVKYGSLIGLAFIINMGYSYFNEVELYSLWSLIRTILFAIVMYVGVAWGKMDFDKHD